MGGNHDDKIKYNLSTFQRFILLLDHKKITGEKVFSSFV